MLSLLGEVSAQQYHARPFRCALMIGSMTAGVALIAALDIVNVSVLAHFRATVEQVAGRAQLQVALGTGEIGFDEAIADLVASEPGVRHAFGLARGTLVTPDARREVLQLIGIDFGSEAKNSYDVRVIEQEGDDIEILNDSTSVFLGAEYAARRGIRVGTRLPFATPTGIKALRVRGLLETHGLARVFGGNLAVMDLPAAQMLLGKGRQIDQVDVQLGDGFEVAAVRERLERRLPGSLTITPPAQRGERFERIIASFQALLTGISIFCLLAAVFVIYNTLATALSQRSPELATLVALGARPRIILCLILAEASVIGVLASGIGVIAGVGLARILLEFVAQSMANIYNTRFNVPSCVPSWANALWYLVVGTAAAVGAALVPAINASRIEPLRLLRSERGDQLSTHPGDGALLWVGGSLLGLTAGAALLEHATRSIEWGNVASALWYVSGTILVIPIMGFAGRGLRSLLPKLFGLSGEIAAEGLTRRPERTGTTTAVIGLSLGVAVLIASVAYSFRASMRNWFILSGDLIVSSMATEGSWLAMPLDATVGNVLQQLPGVERVETYRVLAGQAYQDMRIAVIGVSPGFVEGSLFRSQIIDGDPEAVVRSIYDGTGVVISENFADRVQLGAGDTLVLPTPQGSRRFPIIGVLAADFSADHGSVVLGRARLQKLWGETRVSQFHVFLRPGADAASVRERIGDALGRQYLLKILTVPETLAFHQSKIDEAFGFTYAIQLLVVVVTLAGIVDLLMTDVLERRSEIGILRGIGTDDWRIARALRLEATVIGLAGALFGIIVGLGGALLWVRLNVRILLGFVLEPHFDLSVAALCVVLATAAAVLGGQVAARNALRVPVLDAIRVE
jgi:putative ABC transport system permease protein